MGPTPAEALAASKRPRRKPRHASPSKRPPAWTCSLRARREDLGLSMRDVATAVGLSISALFFLEHGTDPQLTTARRLAEFFGTTTDDLWRPLEIKR